MKETEEKPGNESAGNNVQNAESDQRLNRFLSELIHMQDNRLLKQEDMEALTNKYQLRPEDLEKLNMLTERHLSRALEYKGRERWDNAIVETERALLFMPLENFVRLDLAELYLNRSAKYGYLQKDLQRSEQQVNDALVLEPENREAKDFQKELKKLQDMLKGRESKRPYIALLVLVILILGAAVYPRVRYLLRFSSADEVQTPQTAEAPPWSSRELDYEVTADMSEMLNLSLRDSSLMKEEDSGLTSLSVAGYAEALKNDYEVFDVELFFDDKSLGVIPLVREGAAPLMKGETAVFSAFVYPEGDSDTDSPLHFAVRETKRFTPDADTEWHTIEPYSEIPLPKGVFLDMDSRVDRMIEGYDRSYLFVDLRIRNKSREALSSLDISARWRGEDDLIIAEKDISLVEDSRLPVREGDIRTERIMFSMSKSQSAERASLEVILRKTEKE